MPKGCPSNAFLIDEKCVSSNSVPDSGGCLQIKLLNIHKELGDCVDLSRRMAITSRTFQRNTNRPPSKQYSLAGAFMYEWGLPCRPH
ncbi:hypothetical protein L484_004541 [Morus notabilis]|uniref:Uncharacterized protein n=1 Tax=Morus notabilis TaxID=981085 RepID=W9S2W0_9ROSA|nr:hypothetical protein L484_004541 [Morus notabilis]